MFELETVEGHTIYVNPVQFTFVAQDERRPDLTVVGLACGTVYRTRWPVSKVLKEFKDAVAEVL